ncbi:hypothetical protein IGS59_26205 [Janthinobacterium sp. GW460P]|uniref:hypothetical protein n=1 Tax=unclassified Janthinobacterium TaxID=2610881 RepID=UPI000A320415|nr:MULTISPECIES: hypothetical protein [unclassified Janthinobacterium]MCC7705742.1 hypothetical protein [Janthinobacterium sp. GW460P]MCC7711242.1 hypothetical protein [Janthinobacterium sp. GW460W]
MLSLCAALCLPLSSMAQAISAEDAAFVAATVPVSVPSPPLSLNEHPQIRAGVFKLLGYARGNYTQGDTLVALQVLDSMRSLPDIQRTMLPDGRSVLASINPDAHGAQRAAMLFDPQRKLLALGLVNGHCQAAIGDAVPACLPSTHAVLTVFVPPGAEDEMAAPLLVWARQLPPMLAQAAPEQRQSIAAVEYITTRPGQPGWEPRDVPPGFPPGLLHLLLPSAELNSSASGGKLIAPAGLAGLPMRTPTEAAEAGDEPLPDASITLRSYADFHWVLNTYAKLAKGAQVQGHDDKVVFTGSDTSGRYTVTLREPGKKDSVLITVASWRTK